MAKQTVRLEGFAEFERTLINLSQVWRSDLVARNTLAKAAKEAMVPVAQTAYSLAALGPPNKTGIHMKETIRIDARIPNNKDKQSYFVNDHDAVIAVVSVKKSAVSLANEFGTAKMKSQPFLRPAMSSNVDNVLTILKNSLSEIIPQYVKKLRRQGIR